MGKNGGCSESTIVSGGFKGGTRGAPIMPRDVSLSDSKCWNLVAKTERTYNDSKFLNLFDHFGRFKKVTHLKIVIKIDHNSKKKNVKLILHSFQHSGHYSYKSDHI